MPVPTVDINKTVINVLPSAQRLTLWEMFVQSLASPLVRLYKVFLRYRQGESLIAYDSGTTYVAGDAVQYNFKTWESLADSNTGNQPDISPDWWILRNPSFIGATERTLYNGRYLTLTWALNKYFGTTFRQPPYPDPYGGSGTYSDIYITNVAPDYTSFMMSGPTLSYMYPEYSTGFLFTPPVYTAATTFKFRIHIPTAVFDALGADDDIRESVVRGFTDKYVPAGLIYDIVTY